MFVLILANIFFLISKSALNARKMFILNLRLSSIHIFLNLFFLIYIVYSNVHVVYYFIASSVFIFLFSFIASWELVKNVRTNFIRDLLTFKSDLKLFVRSILKFFIPSLPVLLPTSYLLFILKSPYWIDSTLVWSLSMQLCSIFMMIYSYKYVLYFNDCCEQRFDYIKIKRDVKSSVFVLLALIPFAYFVSIYFNISFLFILIILISLPVQLFNGLLGVKYSIERGRFALYLNLIYSLLFSISLFVSSKINFPLGLALGYTGSYFLVFLIIIRREYNINIRVD